MEIVVTGRHTQIKQRFRDVVESKMNRVTAIAPDAQRVQIVLSHEGNPRQADTAKRVEITVIAGRTVVRAEASSADEFSALDLALDKLTLRLRRTRDRRKDHRRGYTDPVPVDLGPVEPVVVEEPEPEAPNNSPADAVSADLGPGESVEVQVGDTPIVIRRKLHDRTSPFARDYLHAVVDQVTVRDNIATISGSHERLMHAVAGKKTGTDQVPGFMRDWRARRDSNSRPRGS